jgi:uncharacterized membrane protein
MVWLVVVVLGILFIQHREQLNELRALVDRLNGDVRRLQRLFELRGANWDETETSAPAPVPAPPPSIARVVPSAPRPATPLAPAYVPRRKASEEQPPARPIEPVEPLQVTPEMLEEIEAGGKWPEPVDAIGGAAPPAPPPPPVSRGGHGGFELPSIDWENFIGVKLFSWIAGIALALAGVFFLRYSMDHGWLQPAVRMSIGIVVGIALLIGSELRAARRYGITVNALTGAGIAILFSTFFAAHALWHLIPATAAFAMMVLITATAVLLSIRRGSIFIALLGLLGGFATPALVSTGQNNPVGLFSYLLVLNAGLAWVAHRKRWPLLTALSLVFTTIYQWGWVMKFLTAGTVPLAVGVFLVFPILGFAAVIFGRPDARESAASEPAGPWARLFAHTARAGSLVPLAFAVYLAAVPGYGTRWAILFGFLALVDLGLFAIAVARGPKVLHLVGAGTTALVWAVWLNTSYVSDAWPWALPFTALFVTIYLAAPLVADRLGRPLDGISARAVFAAPLLLFTVPVLIGLEPRAVSPWLAFGTLLVLAAACSAYAIRRNESFVHHVAAFFALAAQAVWSIKYLSAAWLIPGLVMYAAFGLFYVATPAIARHLGRPLGPQGAAGVGALAGIALLFFLATGPIAQVSLWGLALLLVIMNLGVFAESAWGRLPELSLAGVVLSWLVLAVWWLSVGVVATAALLMPALTVVAGFALLVLAGNVWARKQAAAAEDNSDVSEFEQGTYLGLAAHLFLIAVAANSALSVPPWPMFGVLAVLNLAIGTAALYLRRGELHLAATGATGLMLMVWVNVAEAAPWPAVAIAAAGAMAALAIGWMFLARRVGAMTFGFEAAAAAAPLLAAIVTVMAGNAGGAPPLAMLVAAHLAFIAAALSIATSDPWRGVAIAAVVPAAVGVLRWQMLHSEPAAWTSHLLFAAPVYAAFLAYPLLLGRRVGQSIEPYVAAILASAFFFLQARRAMILGGYSWMIGALPVVQAGLIATHLAQLVRLERGAARSLGRLALVAGAALAFVTVAIPLQLERQWITVGWALEAAALAWLYGRLPHRGLLMAAAALFTVVFVRLAANPSVLTYEPRGEMRIWNWYLYTYLICAAAMLAGSRLLTRTRDVLRDGTPRLSTLLSAGGVILLFLLLNIEIADFYATGPTITFNFTATLAQDLSYTLGWAVFAVALLAAGIAMKNRPARVAAIALLAITVFKAFLHDLARLGGLYRVGSFVGLAICLALVALALQRFVLTPKTGEAA